MYKQVATAVILTSVCLAPAAFAHDHFGEHCKVEIRQNVEITPDSIRITAEDRTLVQIDHDQRLFVSGDEVPLDLWQQSLITDYSQRIRSTLPMVVDVLLEGVELGAMATSEVFFGITGRELPEPVTEAITDMRRKVERKMKVEEDRIVIRAGHPHDDLFEDLHPELESAIASSMEALIKTVGRSILSGEGSLFERIEDVSYRIEEVGRNIEENIGDRGDDLERKANKMCKNMRSLKEVEGELQREIPALRRYALIASR